MLKKIIINNFRCLKNFTVDFEEDLTLIIGENDSGKTSVVDAIRAAFDNKEIEPQDFHYGEDMIEFLIDIDDLSYKIIYNLDQYNQISKIVRVQLPLSKLKKYLFEINQEDFDNEDKLKNIANLLGLSFRSNTRFDTLKQSVVTKINELLQSDDPVEVESKLPSLKIYILDGKHMEDISLFVNERFFKDKKRDVWEERINGGLTIEEYINNCLQEYAETIEMNINNSSIFKRLQEFLPELSEVKVESDFQKKDLQINVAVKMMENGQEIFIAKKGDGTKRRITLALLDIDDSTPQEKGVYIFDEAETHLHVKAQRDLIHKLNEISEKNQVIVTTHSPFLIDSIKTRQIRAIENYNNQSSIKKLTDPSNIDYILKNLGIENTYLFFARKILLIEGKTEEKFIPIFFENVYNSNLYSHLIKLVDISGVSNISGFSRAMLELNDKSNIFVLIDNDAEKDTLELIEELGLPEDNIFIIGNKEFEDAFSSCVIYNAWKTYVEKNGRKTGSDWTIFNIENLKNKCIEENLKFSEKIKTLNKGCLEKFTKPKLGVALGEYCKREDIDKSLDELLKKLID